VVAIVPNNGALFHFQIVWNRMTFRNHQQKSHRGIVKNVDNTAVSKEKANIHPLLQTVRSETRLTYLAMINFNIRVTEIQMMKHLNLIPVTFEALFRLTAEVHPAATFNY
jgi:hypothetical protein